MMPETMRLSARVGTLISPPADGPPEKNTELQKSRKGTQRERLLFGMIAAANQDGYAGANVSAVIAEAGVSRPTFYEYFADKDECFDAAIDAAGKPLIERVRASIRDVEPEQAMLASVEALIRFASEEPALARFLMNETMGAGAAALNARDQGIISIERLIQARYKSADQAALAPDFSSRMVIGGIYRLLSPRLRRADPKISALLPDLLRWIGSYEQPLSSHQWRGLKLAPRSPRSPFVPETPLQPPPQFPPGRLRLSEDEIAENQRQRIMFAAAQLAQDKGYNATTMNEITKQAHVDGRAFYAMFTDKQDAFMAVHELGFQHVMEVTADAFFSGATWPERNWEAGRAFTQFLEMNPLVANVGFIEAYAVGPGAVQRVEDSHTAFAMLLQEGYHHVRREARPSRMVLETIIATIFEVVYWRVRSGTGARLSGLLPHFTFLVLAAFVGPEQANGFIEEKLAANRKS
jgi:AcrR family transcriptional regulator